MGVTKNRTYWPIGGGTIAFQPGWFRGHLTAFMQVNLGLGMDSSVNIAGGPPNMSNPMVHPFQILGPTNNPYPGTVCLTQIPLPVGANVKAGDEATIQVVETAQHGAALYTVSTSIRNEDERERGRRAALNAPRRAKRGKKEKEKKLTRDSVLISSLRNRVIRESRPSTRPTAIIRPISASRTFIPSPPRIRVPITTRLRPRRGRCERRAGGAGRRCYSPVLRSCSCNGMTFVYSVSRYHTSLGVFLGVWENLGTESCFTALHIHQFHIWLCILIYHSCINHFSIDVFIFPSYFPFFFLHLLEKKKVRATSMVYNANIYPTSFLHSAATVLTLSSDALPAASVTHLLMPGTEEASALDVAATVPSATSPRYSTSESV